MLAERPRAIYDAGVNTRGSRVATIVAITSLVVVLAGFKIHTFLYRWEHNPEGLGREKLADCTNGVIRAGFTAPKSATPYYFVLAGAGEFAGVALFQSGNNVSEKAFDSQSAARCNWLEAQGQPIARILCYDTLRPGTNVQLSVRFTKSPSTNASLWMCWGY